MEEKDLQKLLDGVAEKHKAAIKTEVENAVRGYATLKDIEERFKAVGLEEKVIEKLQKAIEDQGLELKKMFEEKEVKGENLGTILDKQKKEIVKLATGEARRIKIELPSNVYKTLVERASVVSSTQAMRLPEIGVMGYLGAVMTNIFRHAPVSPDSNGVIRYMDQSTQTRNADVKAEGAEAPESAAAWTERTLNIYKIMDSIPVSVEAFRDVLFIQSEIERLLQVNLALKEDDQLYDGSGVAPNLKGVYTSATAFVGTSLDDSVDNANVYDLIAAVKTVMMNGKQSKVAPDFVLMNPLDIFKYKVLKGTDGHYLLPPFVSADGSVVMGMRVIESSQVTANTLVVGDSRYGTIYDLGGVEIEMGYVDDQFTKDTMTIKARKRTALLIRTVDEEAFNKVADVTAAIAALETP